MGGRYAKALDSYLESFVRISGDALPIITEDFLTFNPSKQIPGHYID
jgi:hypothetical protein